jgi:hypothetical protein
MVYPWQLVVSLSSRYVDSVDNLASSRDLGILSLGVDYF